MKNQYSFRLTTTLNPNDATAKTTQVINKVDSNGDKFYPTFTEETVVITNDDRTIIETTRATCNNGVLTFTKRGLPDDGSLTPVANRALTWNPGSLCFVTAGASDRIDKDDDIVWAGKQTYEGDMESKGKATYKGRLITEKGVEYPHFDSLEDLQAYSSPFGGMFAVVDSDGELYRYNDVEEEWAVVTTSTPVQPSQASEVAIGTVRVATDAEFTAGTETGSNGEYLMATVPQIKANIPSMNLNITEVKYRTESISTRNSSSTTNTYTVPRDGWIQIYWYEVVMNGEVVSDITFGGNARQNAIDSNNFIISFLNGSSGTAPNLPFMKIQRKVILPVKAGTISLTLRIADSAAVDTSITGGIKAGIEYFFYFG